MDNLNPAGDSDLGQNHNLVQPQQRLNLPHPSSSNNLFQFQNVQDGRRGMQKRRGGSFRGNRGNKRFNRDRAERFTMIGDASPSPSLSIVPNRQRFPVYVSNMGVEEICDRLYDHKEARDHRLPNYISRNLLKYIVGLAWLNRVNQVAIKTSTSVPPEASLLKNTVGGMLFPPIICDYLEAFGEYRLASGAVVVPRAGNLNQLLAHVNGLQQMFDHRPAIILENEEIPDNQWAIVPQLVDRYNAAISRSNRSGMTYRTVNHLTDGQVAMVCSFEDLPSGQTIGHAPQLLSEPECQLGAAYRIRNHALQEHWPGDFNHLISSSFSSRDFRISEVHSERVLSLMLRSSTSY